MKDRDKDEYYSSFMEWNRDPLEMLVLTSYAHEEIKLPRKFDVAFQVTRPDNFELIKVTITQAVWNGWVPINFIDRGHKHVCVIQFENNFPELFKRISIYTNSSLKDGIQIGLCDVNDFALIKSTLPE